MFTFINTLISSALITVATLGNPTTPNELSFGASAFVTASNQIRLSIVKPTTERLTVTLRDASGQVLYQQFVAKNESKSAILFTVGSLSDGEYDIEIRSKEGRIHKAVTLSTKNQEPVRQVVMQ